MIGDGNITELDRIADEHRDPETEILIRERQAAIFRELANLPHSFREAVILCDVEGFSYEEIAGILDIGIGTVKSRIARGRGALRERLKDF